MNDNTYDYDHVVGCQIRKLREALELTQDELAAQMQVAGCPKITRSALAKIETGQRHIRLFEAKTFSRVLKASLDEDLCV